MLSTQNVWVNGAGRLLNLLYHVYSLFLCYNLIDLKLKKRKKNRLILLNYYITSLIFSIKAKTRKTGAQYNLEEKESENYANRRTSTYRKRSSWLLSAKMKPLVSSLFTSEVSASEITFRSKPK